MGRPKKLTEAEKKECPLVSFRLPAGVREQVKAASMMHGRTQGEQMAQCVIDGLALQGKIREISDALSYDIVDFGKTITIKPDEDACIDFILDAIDKSLEEVKNKRE